MPCSRRRRAVEAERQSTAHSHSSAASMLSVGAAQVRKAASSSASALVGLAPPAIPSASPASAKALAPASTGAVAEMRSNHNLRGRTTRFWMAPASSSVTTGLRRFSKASTTTSHGGSSSTDPITASVAAHTSEPSRAATRRHVSLLSCNGVALPPEVARPNLGNFLGVVGVPAHDCGADDEVVESNMERLSKGACSQTAASATACDGWSPKRHNN
mmetsp:Transcript_96828/g.271046  ORF Transcript_96828/g.271046 Transcript_96828/m.271046 type:complete len:216 (-) Transcript_96828:366-1013(-)